MKQSHWLLFLFFLFLIHDPFLNCIIVLQVAYKSSVGHKYSFSRMVLAQTEPALANILSL